MGFPSSPILSGTGTDFKSLIGSDPLFGQQSSDLSAEGVSAASQRASAIQKYLVQWGVVPDFGASAGRMGLSPDSLGFLNSDVTTQTRDLAAKNTGEGLSMFARITKQNKDNIHQIKAALAARGMARSGEMGYSLGQEAQRNKQELTDNEQQMLDYINGAISAFTTGEAGRKRELAQGMTDAAGRQKDLIGDSGQPNPGGVGPGTTTPGTTTPGGVRITQGSTFDLVRNSGSLPGNAAPAGTPALYNADDPLAQQNVTASGGKGGFWVPEHPGETAAAYAARVNALQAANPGVHIMLDIEGSGKGYPGTPGYQWTQDVMAAVTVGGNLSVTVPGGGEDDFNYQPFIDSGATIWIQTYGATTSDLMDPQERYDMMIKRGVPPDQIGLMLMPGQTPVPGVKFSYYTLDDMSGIAPQGDTAPAPAAQPAPTPAPASSPYQQKMADVQQTIAGGYGGYVPGTSAPAPAPAPLFAPSAGGSNYAKAS